MRKPSSLLVASLVVLSLSVVLSSNLETSSPTKVAVKVKSDSQLTAVRTQKCASIVPVKLFEWADGDWLPLDVARARDAGWAEELAARAPVTIQELRVLTFNIWFSHNHRAARTEELLRILAAIEADVVALQEVTERSADDILRDPTVRARYLATPKSSVTVDNWYGTMTLVARQLEGIHYAEYCSFGSPRSELGRGLLRVDVARSAGPAIAVGNVHLESPVPGVTADHRATQLRICADLLRQPATTSSAGALTEDYVLMGDFNFISEDESAGISDNSLVDCWTHLKNTTTPTYDHTRNKNIKKSFISRPDRITCSKRLSPQSVELIGERTILSTGLPPSDHFGLLATVKVSESRAEL